MRFGPPPAFPACFGGFRPRPGLWRGRHRQPLDQVRGALVPGICLQPPRHLAQPLGERAVAEQPVDRRGEVPIGERVGGQPDAEAVSWTRWALSCWSQKMGRTTMGLPKCMHSVVVLLPPCVITRSTCGEGMSAAGTPRPPCCPRARSASCWGPLRDDERCGVSAERLDEPLHQRHVAGAQGAEADVDRAPRRRQRARAAAPGASVVRTLDSRLCHVGAERPRARVVELARDRGRGSATAIRG